jgi:hypothetical protein
MAAGALVVDGERSAALSLLTVTRKRGISDRLAFEMGCVGKGS